jgi:hypothetical protein
MIVDQSAADQAPPQGRTRRESGNVPRSRSPSRTTDIHRAGSISAPASVPDLQRRCGASDEHDGEAAGERFRALPEASNITSK